jgi:hypothetical protein
VVTESRGFFCGCAQNAPTASEELLYFRSMTQ